MKKLALLLFFCILNTVLYAQEFSIGVAPELSLPTGNSANRSTVGFGASVKTEMNFAQYFGLTANFGYHNFISRKYFGIRPSNITAFPLKLGLKYYTHPSFFFEGQVGSALNMSSSAKNEKAWSLGIGTYARGKNAKHRVNFGIRYESWTEPINQITGGTYRSNHFDFVALKLTYEWPL